MTFKPSLPFPWVQVVKLDHPSSSSTICIYFFYFNFEDFKHIYRHNQSQENWKRHHCLNHYCDKNWSWVCKSMNNGTLGTFICIPHPGHNLCNTALVSKSKCKLTRRFLICFSGVLFFVLVFRCC